jgi:hypothetical protein
MDNNNVDNRSLSGYNKDNLNDEYARIAGIDQHTEIVKMDEQKPINDTECRHPILIPDPDDTIEDAVYHGCSNVKCGVGFYIRKQKP